MDRVFPFSDLLPELQLCIFEQLDRPTLHSAVRVNKQWCEISAHLLWGHPSPGRIKNLASLRLRQRRQYYASKVRRLELKRSGATRAFDTLVFASLRMLWLSDDLNIPTTKFQLVPYLQSKLHSLRLPGCELDSQSLDLIASSCPTLTTLWIAGPSEKVRDVDFARFIQSLSCLRKLFLSDSFSVSATNHMLKTNTETLAPRIERLGLFDVTDLPDPELFRMFMLNCRSLKHLSLAGLTQQQPLRLMTGRLLAHVLEVNPLRIIDGDWLSSELLEQMPVPSASAQSLRKLRSLRQYLCSSSAVSALQQVSNRLRGLELCLYDVTTELFSSIGRQKQLTRLALTLMTDEEVFSITHLSALSGLKQLEHLEITYRFTPAGPTTIHGLDDGTFAQWIPNFPRLRTLIMNTYSSSLDAASIRSLSQACPLLQRCALIYPHDLSTWFPDQRAPKLLFPNLTRLYLGKVAYFMPIGPFDLMSSLETLEPATLEHVILGIPLRHRAKVCAKMLLECMPSLQSLGVETSTKSGKALLNALDELRPCKPLLGAGDVAEVPIITIREEFCVEDFLNYG